MMYRTGNFCYMAKAIKFSRLPSKTWLYLLAPYAL
jgi:hypothetical protein